MTSSLRPNLPPGMSLAEAQAKLDSMVWHHSLDFGEGLVSKSAATVDFINKSAEILFGQLDMAGKSMLDVGAWTGAFSFDAKRRGAARVVASDHYVWTHPHFRGREAFDFALGLTGLDIEAQEIDVPDISPDSVGMFDAVLFSGVFYHLLDPINLTRRVGKCAEHLLIVETIHDALDNPRPAMIYYPGAILNNDSTNFWGPNPHCMYELLTELGFTDIWYQDAYLIEKRGVYHAFRSPESRAAMGWRDDGSISLSVEENRRALFAPR